MPGKKTRRDAGEAGLTITSLMDAMTIILCFLLKSYSVTDVTVTASEELQIPSSSALQDIKTSVQLVVSRAGILVDGDPAVEVETVDGDGGVPTYQVAESEKKGQLITALYDILLDKAEEQKEIAAQTGLTEAEFKGQILLQCDKKLPFALIREVMYTAGQAQFSEFKFVVVKTSG
ncbi:MAG: ExbD/TolR family protein [Myxococcota bacterium]